MPSGIFIIWILYLPSSHGLPANNFQPALQIELLGSRTVGPGTAESTHSAWTRTAACSPPSSWPWSQSLLACGPPQPAEICSLTPASCNKVDLFSRIGSVSYSCILNFIVSCTAPVHQVHAQRCYFRVPNTNGFLSPLKDFEVSFSPPHSSSLTFYSLCQSVSMWRAAGPLLSGAGCD